MPEWSTTKWRNNVLLCVSSNITSYSTAVAVLDCSLFQIKSLLLLWYETLETVIKMELPHLGKHCSEKSCRQLDFLPMKCDACSEIFCKDHLQYDDHSCRSSYKKNIQVTINNNLNQRTLTKRHSLHFGLFCRASS